MLIVINSFKLALLVIKRNIVSNFIFKINYAFQIDNYYIKKHILMITCH